MNSKYQ